MAGRLLSLGHWNRLLLLCMEWSKSLVSRCVEESES